MGDESDRYRERARHSRKLAQQARDPQARDTLSRMADELEAEAAAIDARKEASRGG
jgi:hypothetical protein